MEISVRHSKVIVKVEFSAILLTLFVLYCVLEVLRIAYIGRLEAFPMSIGLLALGVTMIVGLRKHLAKKRVAASKCGHLFSSKLTKVIMSSYVASITLILSVTMALSVDFPSFLMVQLVLLASLWLDNRGFNVSLNMLRASFIFTVIYVSYVLLLTKNTFIGLVTLVYFVSWLYLQIKIEQPRLLEGMSRIC